MVRDKRKKSWNIRYEYVVEHVDRDGGTVYKVRRVSLSSSQP